ncbi:MAG TPA: Spy/CpxP family protein refolding chaperone [Burkholderiales bacterium]|nr:Spy/CpxP family protein refolding chaperone [Burkholderiales bacterium]
MKRATKIAAVLGLALGAALAGTTVQAHPYGSGPGWGMRGGMGMGYGMGPGMGPGACTAEAACPGMGPGYGRGPSFGRGPGYAPGGNVAPGAFLEDRLAGLKSELGITAAQEGVWNAYADEAKKQADAMAKLHQAMRESTSTVPERMELRNQMWKQREAGSEAMTKKTKELYAALTPEQKSIADRRLGGFGAGMGGGPRVGWR